jgi:murein DD-endopeptidase MepM/ murein hydrolase activator NlpD
VGQEVLVARSVPFLGVKVIREETYEQEVNFKIQQTQDTAKLQGYVNIKQVGQRGVNQILAKVTYIDGVESSREIVSTTVLKEPVNEIVVVGGMKPLEQLPASAMNTSTGFIWPVDGGGYVSCAFNGYPGHTGMDIAGLSAGTGVRAAASGTVVMVKNLSTGYGRHVMIDHGGNVQTLYAHNSQIYVKVGDWVEQGQLIAAMGRTGRATGVHLHFEIRINGRYMNPAKYIGYK